VEKIQVIYIAGQGRNGSTLVDRILGTLDGVASMAEVYRVLKDGVVDGKRCACGESIHTCPFWSRVLSWMSPDEIRQALRLQDAVDRSRYFFALFTGQYNQWFRSQLDEYKIFLQRFYEAIAHQTGCRILVDSSKVPSRALILSTLPNIDVSVVHVVRDVRASIYAWQSDKFDPASGQLMNKISSRKTFLAWVARNILCEQLALKMPYHRIAYEALAKDPQTVMQSLVHQLKPIADLTLPFCDERSIALPMNHTIGGNPDRFKVGLTQIQPDERWKTGLSPFLRRSSGVLALPLLARYGLLRDSFNR
jgi:Sulfotransferase family